MSLSQEKNVVGIIEHEIYLTALSGNKAVEKCKKYDLVFKKKIDNGCLFVFLGDTTQESSHEEDTLSSSELMNPKEKWEKDKLQRTHHPENLS